MGQICIQTIKDRLAKPWRHALGNHVNPGTNGIPLLTERIHVGFHLGNLVRIRAEKRVLMNLLPIQLFGLDWAQLRQITANPDSQALLQEFPCNRAGSHTHGSLTGGRTTTTAVIPNSVLVHVGIVGVSRSELFGDLGIILGALVSILDHQTDRRACGLTLKHTGQNSYLIGFPTLGGMPGGARLATIKIPLHICLRELEPGRTAINNAPQCRPVAFAK